MTRALIVLSGGIDSAVALAIASQTAKDLVAVTFQYHLRPQRESFAVYRLLRQYPAKLVELPLPFISEFNDLPGSLKRDLPEGYISNRNLIFYSLAAYVAEANGCGVIYGGHHGEDSLSFPDAKQEFFASMQRMLNEALLVQKIRIELPLHNLSKMDVLKLAVKLGVPLQHTWSCYWDKPQPCGKCSSCNERAEAFEKLGIPDPLLTE